jgi:hypothetical protein
VHNRELSFVLEESVSEELETVGEEVMVVRLLKDARTASDIANEILEEGPDNDIDYLGHYKIDLIQERIVNGGLASTLRHMELFEVFATDHILLSG